MESRPLEESSEAEDDASRGSGLGESGDGRDADERGMARGGGIKSSWRGGRSSGRGRGQDKPGMEDVAENDLAKLGSDDSSSGKGRMYDIGLESTIGESMDVLNHDEPPGDLTIEIPPDDNPPSIQQFRKPPKAHDNFSPFVPLETDAETQRERPPPPDSESSSVPPTVQIATTEPPRHDVFWGNLYLISVAALFASFLLIYLHTSVSSLKRPLDTVYTTLHASFYLLAVDTLVAILISLFWLALLRSYVRPLVYTILVAVPVILFAFALYPLISSFKGAWHGESVQDKAMRWLSSIPGIVAVGWIYAVYRGRHSFEKAISILEFSCRILAANPALLLLGFGTLFGVVAWTWLWMGMFTRVFLGGHLVMSKSFFVIDMSTWWLAIFFILVYLWTLGVGAGIQRATTAATVSQWYFHRLAVPAPTSRQVVRAALGHSITTLFGTICFSTLLALLIRLPLLVVPRRFVALLGLCTYTFMPNSTALLTHPITLTYSAIHSQPLVSSTRAVSQFAFMGGSNLRTAPQLRSRNASYVVTSSILPYNLALLLLHSTRIITSFAFGFGAWVNTARSLTISDASTVRGSLYAYIVGLIAAAIGWGILGAMEGVLTGVVDAAVVCWGSEVRNGEVRYCREAGWLFGDEGGEGEREGLMRI